MTVLKFTTYSDVTLPYLTLNLPRIFSSSDSTLAANQRALSES